MLGLKGVLNISAKGGLLKKLDLKLKFWLE